MKWNRRQNFLLTNDCTETKTVLQTPFRIKEEVMAMRHPNLFISLLQEIAICFLVLQGFFSHEA